MIVERDVEGRRVEVRGLDAAHVRARRDPGETAGEILPRAPVVAREPHVPVVGAGKQQPRPDRRLGERDDRAERLGTGDVGGDATGRARAHPDPHRVLGRQVRRNRIQILATLRRLHHFIGAGVERLRTVRGDEERRVPVPAKIGVVRIGFLPHPQLRDVALLRRGLRSGRVGALDDDRVLVLGVARPPVRLLQHGALAGREVEPRHVATLGFDIDRVRVGGILRRVKAVATADGGPVGVGDVALTAARRSAPRAVVLIAGADAVGEVHVVADDVRLADRERVQEVPVAALVPRLRDPTIVAHDDVTGIVGIDPHRVVVDVNPDCRVADRLAAVIREVQRRRGEVDALRISGIDAHLGIVEGAHVGAVHLFPRPAAIARPVESGGSSLWRLARAALGVGRGIGFEHQIHDLRVGGGDRDADASLRRFGKTAPLDLGPGLPAVRGLPESAPRSTGSKEVRSTYTLPACCEQHVGIRRVHCDVYHSRLI